MATNYAAEVLTDLSPRDVYNLMIPPGLQDVKESNNPDDFTPIDLQFFHLGSYLATRLDPASWRQMLDVKNALLLQCSEQGLTRGRCREFVRQTWRLVYEELSREYGSLCPILFTFNNGGDHLLFGSDGLLYPSYRIRYTDEATAWQTAYGADLIARGEALPCELASREELWDLWAKENRQVIYPKEITVMNLTATTVGDVDLEGPDDPEDDKGDDVGSQTGSETRSEESYGSPDEGEAPLDDFPPRQSRTPTPQSTHSGTVAKVAVKQEKPEDQPRDTTMGGNEQQKMRDQAEKELAPAAKKSPFKVKEEPYLPRYEEYLAQRAATRRSTSSLTDPGRDPGHFNRMSPMGPKRQDDFDLPPPLNRQLNRGEQSFSPSHPMPRFLGMQFREPSGSDPRLGLLNRGPVLGSVRGSADRVADVRSKIKATSTPTQKAVVRRTHKVPAAKPKLTDKDNVKRVLNDPKAAMAMGDHLRPFDLVKLNRKVTEAGGEGSEGHSDSSSPYTCS